MKTINWEMSEVQSERLPAFEAHLRSVVRKGLADLGLPLPAEQNTLIEAEGLTIRFEEGYGENAIDPKTLEGGGEIDLSSTGPVPMLLLLLAQKSFREGFVNSEEQISFCDTDGGLVAPKKWAEIVELFSDLDHDLGEVRKMAETLNLVSGPLKIMADDVEEEDGLDAWF